MCLQCADLFIEKLLLVVAWFNVAVTFIKYFELTHITLYGCFQQLVPVEKWSLFVVFKIKPASACIQAIFAVCLQRPRFFMQKQEAETGFQWRGWLKLKAPEITLPHPCDYGPLRWAPRAVNTRFCLPGADEAWGQAMCSFMPGCQPGLGWPFPPIWTHKWFNLLKEGPDAGVSCGLMGMGLEETEQLWQRSMTRAVGSRSHRRRGSPTEQEVT